MTNRIKVNAAPGDAFSTIDGLSDPHGMVCKCQPGYYSPSTTEDYRSSCLACPQGKYSDEIGVLYVTGAVIDPCTSCPVGKSTVATGSTSSDTTGDACNECDFGQSTNPGLAVMPVGEHGAGAAGNLICRACDNDEYGWSSAQCLGNDDGMGARCTLNATGDGCAVDGGDCAFAPPAVSTEQGGGPICKTRTCSCDNGNAQNPCVDSNPKVGDKQFCDTCYPGYSESSTSVRTSLRVGEADEEVQVSVKHCIANTCSCPHGTHAVTGDIVAGGGTGVSHGVIKCGTSIGERGGGEETTVIVNHVTMVIT
jgi:hypothetical protein